MKRLITVVLSLLLFLFTAFAAACTERTPQGTQIGGATSGEGNGGEIDPNAPFSVQIKTSDGSELKTLEEDGISAVWTERTSAKTIYTAPFNADGLATSKEPDGEYRVTLSKLPVGYTYDPNAYDVDNRNKSATITLYPLRQFTGGDGKSDNQYRAETTGAYRLTFRKMTDAFYVLFSAPYAGKISVMSLLDVTEDKLLPVLGECWHETNPNVRREIIGGGTSNEYTRNFYSEYNLTGSQSQLFKIEIRSKEEKPPLPVVLDVLFEKSDYQAEDYGLKVVARPSLKLPDDLRQDLTGGQWRAKKPSGTFRLLAKSTRPPWTAKDMTFDEKMVTFDKKTGYYYLNKNYGKTDKEPEPDLRYPIYAVLARDIDGIINTDDLNGVHDWGLSRQENYYCPSSGKNYNLFIQAYLDKVSTDGSYPVDAALKEFLYDFSVSKKVFYDKYGSFLAEQSGFKSDEESRWLFVCGYYS